MSRRRSPAGRRIAALTVLAAVAAAPVTPLVGPVQRGDRALLSAVVRGRRTSWVGPARRLTELAAPRVVTAATAVAAVSALVRGRSLQSVVRTVGAAGTGILLRRGLAEAVRRPRPPVARWADTPSGFSYPSRHVTWAVLGYGAVRDLALTDPRRRWRGVHAGLVGVVAATRLLLAVHWPTDVLAALIYAAAWRGLTRSTVVPGRWARRHGAEARAGPR